MSVCRCFLLDFLKIQIAKRRQSVAGEQSVREFRFRLEKTVMQKRRTNLCLSGSAMAVTSDKVKTMKLRRAPT